MLITQYSLSRCADSYLIIFLYSINCSLAFLNASFLQQFPSHCELSIFQHTMFQILQSSSYIFQILASLVMYDPTNLSYLFLSSKLIFYLKAKEACSLKTWFYFFKTQSIFFFIFNFSQSIPLINFLYFSIYFSLLAFSIFNLCKQQIYITTWEASSSRYQMSLAVIFSKLTESLSRLLRKLFLTIQYVSSLQCSCTSLSTPPIVLFSISSLSLLLLPRSSSRPESNKLGCSALLLKESSRILLVMLFVLRVSPLMDNIYVLTYFRFSISFLMDCNSSCCDFKSYSQFIRSAFRYFISMACLSYQDRNDDQRVVMWPNLNLSTIFINVKLMTGN